MRASRVASLVVLIVALSFGCLFEKARRDGAACSTDQTCPPGQRCSSDGQCLYPCPSSSCSDSECGCSNIDHGNINGPSGGFSCESDGLCHYRCAPSGDNVNGDCPGYMNCYVPTMLCLPACTDTSQCANGASCVPTGRMSNTNTPPNYCVGHPWSPDGGVPDGGIPDGGRDAASPGDGGCGASCPPSGVYSIQVDGAGTQLQLYVDNDTDGGGWILVGQVGGLYALPTTWLKSQQRISDLMDPGIKSGKLACFDATWLAVNRASEIRLSNSDRSRWVKWALPAGRTEATWWNHATGQTVVAAAQPLPVTVTRWSGQTDQCYQNVYGINPFYDHGGGYPSATSNQMGTTNSGDGCMSIGISANATFVDGFGQNGNGYDAPINESDWPNAELAQAPWVNVWLR